jgi:TolB-like protein
MKNVFYVFLLTLLFSCSQQKLSQKTDFQDTGKSLQFQLNQLSNDISANVTDKNIKKIAVLPFTDLDGRNSNFGNYLAEELTTLIHKQKQFDIYERGQLSKIITEHELNLSGLIDENSIRELGKFSGVDAILTGSYARFANFTTINGRMISTEKAAIVSTASVNIENDELKDFFTQGNDKMNTHLQKHRLEKSDFLIELTGCELQNKSLICSMTITNLHYDDRFFLVQYGNPSTKIHDMQGNEYIVSTVEIANQKKTFQPGGSGYQTNKKKLISNIPTSLRLIFENVNPEIHQLALLEMNGGRELGIISFYTISVTK